jgi:hypothetical protein
MTENELQRLAKKIMKWANETGFTISDEKTKTLLVYRRRPRVQSRPTLKIWRGECMLEMVRHHKILGLIFDEKLNWTEHLKTVKARASKKLNLLKTLAHKEWRGGAQKTLLSLHQMVVLSTLRYGETVCG